MASSHHQVNTLHRIMMCVWDIFDCFSSFDEEFTVHFPSLNATIQTPIENVFPLGQLPFPAEAVCGPLSAVCHRGL